MSDHYLDELWSKYTISPDPLSGMQSLYQACKTFTTYALQPSDIILSGGEFTLHRQLAEPLQEIARAMDHLLLRAAQYHRLSDAPSIGQLDVQILTGSTALHASTTINQVLLSWVTITDRLAEAMRELKYLCVGDPLYLSRHKWQTRIPQILASLPPVLRVKLPKAFLKLHGIMVLPTPKNSPCLSRLVPHSSADTIMDVKIQREPRRPPSAARHVKSAIHRESTQIPVRAEGRRETEIAIDGEHYMRHEIPWEECPWRTSDELLRASRVQPLTKRPSSSQFYPLQSPPLPARAECHEGWLSVKAMVAAIEAREHSKACSVELRQLRHSHQQMDYKYSEIHTLGRTARTKDPPSVSAAMGPTPLLEQAAFAFGVLELSSLIQSSAPALVADEGMVELGGLEECRKSAESVESENIQALTMAIPSISYSSARSERLTHDAYGPESAAPASAVDLWGLGENSLTKDQCHRRHHVLRRRVSSPRNRLSSTPAVVIDEGLVELGGLDESLRVPAKSLAFIQDGESPTGWNSAENEPSRRRESGPRILGICSKSCLQDHAVIVTEMSSSLTSPAPALVQHDDAVEFGGPIRPSRAGASLTVPCANLLVCRHGYPASDGEPMEGSTCTAYPARRSSSAEEGFNRCQEQPGFAYPVVDAQSETSASDQLSIHGHTRDTCVIELGQHKDRVRASATPWRRNVADVPSPQRLASSLVHENRVELGGLENTATMPNEQREGPHTAESRTLDAASTTRVRPPSPTHISILALASPSCSPQSVANLVTGIMTFVLVSTIVRTHRNAYLAGILREELAPYIAWEREGIGTRCCLRYLGAGARERI
ncbi:hypothetical protein B0H11DRAFT_2213896 [Mycena galericulata]|nr:hypothetical protein B0H11DRAFT_2213896 [Mycena galericulata]